MKIVTYFEDCYAELVHKVSWPSWKDLQSSAMVVLVASLIIAIVIFAMDMFLENILEFIYGLFF